MSSLWLDTHTVTVPQTPFPQDQKYDAAVAGAGLTGLTIAVLLARAGLRTVVLEARHIGAAATGNTTAKVSLLQGSQLSSIRSHRSDEILQAYVEGNREAQAWLLRYLDEHGIGYQHRTAWTVAHTAEGVQTLENEYEAAQTAALPVEWQQPTELPYQVESAIALKDQAQIHPVEVLDALATELLERGGQIVQGARLIDAENGPPVEVKTTAGSLQTDRLILATGAPVLDRGGHFATMQGHRSYALAYRIPSGTPVPQGMHLSVDEPSRSLRTASAAGEELLLVGGNGHVVGRADSPAQAVADIEDWTQRHFPGAQRTHSWSAQDYRPADYVPFFGKLRRGGGNIYLATGYNKWGMTNAVAAALGVSAEILGGQMHWAQTLSERGPAIRGAVTAVKDNAEIGARMVKDWGSAEVGALPDAPPEEGRGVVGRSGGKPVAVSTLEGATRKVSAVCPHMGGILQWNDAECSWDCPLHASRFAPDGTLLEGPAVSDLKSAE
ncbi:FAD-dependent oxidoreductase [Nesterenkonia ebinurensis]|uniref:FAD-dependent oxidoreductase n=1 Tax=Nesterenkonia ebinurensis TaxID=2608252 RepID=UPI00123D0D12|nr:FAD-dependent oxidoreductase [Nesterenkonia ebinurensis]